MNSTKMNLTFLLTLLFKTTQGRVFDDTRMLTVVGSLLDQAIDSHGVNEPVTGARVGTENCDKDCLDHPNNLHDENGRLKLWG